MITTLLMFHAFVAVALMGALTHQTVSAIWPPKSPGNGFFTRFRATRTMTYTNVILILYALEVTLGALLYPAYRIHVRVVLEDLGLRAPTGVFEIKEHYAALGLGMLPAYWFYWKQPAEEYKGAKAWFTGILCFTVYYNFLIGHILNNMRGFGL